MRGFRAVTTLAEVTLSFVTKGVNEPLASVTFEARASILARASASETSSRRASSTLPVPESSRASWLAS